MKQLHGHLVANPNLMTDFEAYIPRSVDFMMTIRLKFPDGMSFEQLRILVTQTFSSIDTIGFTNDEVLERLTDSGLANFIAEGISNATIRFLCRDYELRDREFVFRVVDVVSF